MAEHIDGPLYYERMGRRGRSWRSCIQIRWTSHAGSSRWRSFRPGTVDRHRHPGLWPLAKSLSGARMQDTAQACWQAVDAIGRGERAILVGCSVGSALVTYMHHLYPSRTAALVLSGTGYNPGKEFAHRRIAAYKQHGIDYRWSYTFEDFSPAFPRNTLARFFADLFTERNGACRSRAHHPSIRGATRSPTPRTTRPASLVPPSYSAAAKTPTQPKRVCVAGTHSRLRDEGPARRWTRLSDRATLAIQSAP